MTRTLRDALLGGPGLDGYAYCADTLCVDCGQDAIRELYAEEGYEPSDDTDNEPQPIFFGDTDRAVHCCQCGEYLYGHNSCDDCGTDLPEDATGKCEDCLLPRCSECGEELEAEGKALPGKCLIDWGACPECVASAIEALPPYARDSSMPTGWGRP